MHPNLLLNLPISVPSRIINPKSRPINPKLVSAHFRVRIRNHPPHYNPIPNCMNKPTPWLHRLVSYKRLYCNSAQWDRLMNTRARHGRCNCNYYVSLRSMKSYEYDCILCSFDYSVFSEKFWDNRWFALFGFVLYIDMKVSDLLNMNRCLK